VAGCCECGDEPSGSGATELVSYWLLPYYRNIAACTATVAGASSLSICTPPVWNTSTPVSSGQNVPHCDMRSAHTVCTNQECYKIKAVVR
jgi:hypothetical protein